MCQTQGLEKHKENTGMSFVSFDHIHQTCASVVMVTLCGHSEVNHLMCIRKLTRWMLDFLKLKCVHISMENKVT